MAKIRVWTVGKLTNDPMTTIIPTKNHLAKIKQIIKESVDNSGDLILGPEVSFREIDTDIENYIEIDENTLKKIKHDTA